MRYRSLALELQRHAILGVLAVLVIGCSGPAATPSTTPATDPPSSPPIATPPTPEPASASPTGNPTARGWLAAAPMLSARHGFDAVVLGDGTVLAVGDDYDCIPGGASAGSERAELYDPAADTWVEVEGLNKSRKSFATVALRNGTALVAGGVNADDVPYSSIWIFDPATRRWRTGGLLHQARGAPLMVALSDGRALILGGWGVGTGAGELSTAEIYDPDPGSWTQTGSLPEIVRVRDAVGLDDGGALALGYDYTDSEPVRTAFVFDPSSEVWTRVDTPDNPYGSELVAMHDGNALIVGGTNGGELEGGDGSVTDWVSLFDSSSGRWLAQAQMSTPRIGSQTALLPDGRVLVAGGAVRDEYRSGEMATGAEVFDQSANQWTSISDPLEPRKDGRTVVLHDGSALVLGGDAEFNVHGDTPWCATPLASVERLYPGS